MKLQKEKNEASDNSESAHSINPDGRYRLKCKSCLEDVLLTQFACSRCNSKVAFIESDKFTSQYTAVCQSCGEEKTISDIPKVCLCDSANIGWMSCEEKKWYQPQLASKNADKNLVWITGDFDGEFSGKKNNLTILDFGPQGKAYDFTILKGQLSNVERVRSAPKRIAKDEPIPIRQSLVETALHDSETD